MVVVRGSCTCDEDQPMHVQVALEILRSYAPLTVLHISCWRIMITIIMYIALPPDACTPYSRAGC